MPAADLALLPGVQRKAGNVTAPLCAPPASVVASRFCTVVLLAQTAGGGSAAAGLNATEFRFIWTTLQKDGEEGMASNDSSAVGPRNGPASSGWQYPGFRASSTSVRFSLTMTLLVVARL